MRLLLPFLVLFPFFFAYSNIQVIATEEAPSVQTVCHLYLVHCTQEQWQQQVQTVIDRHENIKGKPLYVLLDLKQEEAETTLQAISKDHLGEEVVIATHEGIFNLLASHLGIEPLAILQGSMVVIEGDADTLYLRKSYGKLWNRIIGQLK